MRAVVLCALLVTIATGARAAAQPCIGDCDGDGTVRVHELLLGLQVDLGTRALDACPAIDCNADVPAIIIACEVIAVRNALNGCGAVNVDAVWMYQPACRQCMGCAVSIAELIQAINNGIPPELLPDGVTVLDFRIEIPRVACAACGCPLVGSPIYEILVARTDVDQLVAAGWLPFNP